MKKFLFTISLFLVAYSLFAQQEPLMKIYMDDGSTKQYNLKDIDSLGIIDNKNFYDMKIHYQGTLIAYYPTEIIESIKFENDTNNNKVLNVYLFGYPKTYVLSSLDSIIFYKDIYQPLTIGSQVWMLKNLNVDHYRNGDSIPEVKNWDQWTALKTGAWCFYNNESDSGQIYGKLYNWYTVNDPRGLAPKGWHVTGKAEWYSLIEFLGGDNVAGGKLKSKGTIYAGDGLWLYPNEGATNESGFSAIPAGCRYDGSFSAIGGIGYWWTTWYLYNVPFSWYMGIEYGYSVIRSNYSERYYGYSVRCIKDE
jgi:uncharacterized protein (TIGR02145 family)